MLSWRSRHSGLLAACALLASASTASAQTSGQWCGATVSHMLIEGSGALMVLPSFRGDWLMICNVNGAWNGVPPDVCRSWQATITSAMLSGKTQTFYYPTTTACNALPTYTNAPAPGYVSLQK